MYKFHPILSIALVLISISWSAAANPDREHSVRTVHFAKGSTTTIIKGNVLGYNYVDYRLRASAGQTLRVRMQAGNPSNYFNVNPPDSGDVSMFIGGGGDKAFESMLPADGSYVIRVYLMRASARRNEESNYTLSISIEGKPLKPVSGKIDARIPGCLFHVVSGLGQSTALKRPGMPELSVATTL